MIKKILFVMVVFSLVAATCFAKIPASRIALGGLTPGCTLEYAESIYGPAKKVYKERRFKADPEFYYYFGDSFYCSPNFEDIYTDADNGIATPDGVHVGGIEWDFIRKYDTYKWAKFDDDFSLNYTVCYEALENTKEPPYICMYIRVEDAKIKKISVHKFHH